jgi:hypothetical protein
MTDSTLLLQMFEEEASADQEVILTNILVPAMESALMTVTKAELSEPEIRSGREGQYASAQVRMTFHVDEDAAREATGQDKPIMFHNVRLRLKMDEKSGKVSFDWDNNKDLYRLFTILGVKVYKSVNGKDRFNGSVKNWVLDVVGCSLKGKITHEVIKAQSESGEWDAVKIDPITGEPEYKAVLKAYSAVK